MQAVCMHARLQSVTAGISSFTTDVVPCNMCFSTCSSFPNTIYCLQTKASAQPAAVAEPPRGRHLHACSARFLQHTLAVSAPGLVVFRVVICGAGIIGSAIAYYLAVKGVAATVVERASVACASSGIMLKLYTESVPSMTPCTCGLSATAQLASGF